MRQSSAQLGRQLTKYFGSASSIVLDSDSNMTMKAPLYEWPIGLICDAGAAQGCAPLAANGFVHASTDMGHDCDNK